MRYLSVCSGIEAATVAWHPLGWEAVAYSEIDPFCRSLLKHHYPTTPLHGDFTTIQGDEYGSVDLICGGTPCQSFSVAGKRAGMDDPRGNLSIEFLKLAVRSGAAWLVWENVPGILSSWSDNEESNDFDTFLSFLGECGYGFAWRVLDAQYFGVPQRRRRVVVVGYFGDWRPAAAVLFERESLSRDITPRREEGQDVAGTVGARTGLSSGADDAANGRMIPSVAWALQERDGKGADSSTKQGHLIPVAFSQNIRDEVREMSVVGALSANPGMKQTSYIRNDMVVRRLTPRECERLQGFPDDYTLVPHRGKPASDSVRYAAIGNSWAVPKFRWVGQRIAMMQQIMEGL